MTTGLKVRRVIEHEVYIPDLGIRIQDARKAISKPLTILCKEAGVSRNYWYQLEAGKIQGAVSEEMIRKIEKVLNINLGIDFEKSVAS